MLVNSKLLTFLFYGAVLSFVLCRIQHYLARNRSSSLLYWRNSPILSNAVFQLARNIYVEYAILTVKIFFSSDQKLKLLFLTSHRRLLGLKKLFEQLDDAVDSMTPEEILSLGNSVLGPTMSPFLSKILNEEDLYFINQLHSDGFLTKEEVFSFCNLIAHKLSIEASLTTSYEQEHEPEGKAVLRQRIAQENIEITGIYFIFVTHFIQKDKRVLDLLSCNEFSYDLLKNIYPKSGQIGELDQIKHDTIEHRYDLQQERLVGKISPNYFLAQQESNGNLVDAQRALNKLSNRPVTYYELPAMIQQNYLKIRAHFIKHALMLGKITGIIFIVIWEYQYRIGFYTTKPRSWRSSKTRLE